MAENLIINGENKRELYETLLPQLQSLTAGETDVVANMANVAAALKQTFDFFWVGFYVVKEEMLVLAPFQGPLACTRIRYGKGVCGTAWKDAQTIVVPDVEQAERVRQDRCGISGTTLRNLTVLNGGKHIIVTTLPPLIRPGRIHMI